MNQGAKKFYYLVVIRDGFVLVTFLFESGIYVV
jgi:hypothetical protein